MWTRGAREQTDVYSDICIPRPCHTGLHLTHRHCTSMICCACAEIHKGCKNLMPAVACVFTQTPRVLRAQARMGYLETHTDQTCGFVQKLRVWVTPFHARTHVHTCFFTESTHMHFFWTVTGLKELGFNSLEEVQRQTLKTLLFPIILTRRGKAGDSSQSRGDRRRSS